MNRTTRCIRALCECGIMVASAQVLSYLKLFSLPNGGSVTLNMLPVFLICFRWGFGYGMLTSFAFSLLQLLLDGAYAWGWQSILGDYLLAYSILGIAGLMKNIRGGFFLGILLGGMGRFLVAWITGATVWAEYMPENFFGMTMTSPWIYSALYNGSYIFAGLALCMTAGILLWKPIKRLNRIFPTR